MTQKEFYQKLGELCLEYAKSFKEKAIQQDLPLLKMGNDYDVDTETLTQSRPITNIEIKNAINTCAKQFDVDEYLDTHRYTQNEIAKIYNPNAYNPSAYIAKILVDKDMMFSDYKGKLHFMEKGLDKQFEINWQRVKGLYWDFTVNAEGKNYIINELNTSK